jgi:hypothetical protein
MDEDVELNENSGRIVEDTGPPDEKYLLPDLWNDLPNYGCPYCGHKTVRGRIAIEEHIFDEHPEHLEEL